jgi:flagellar protein FliO/FliZ
LTFDFWSWFQVVLALALVLGAIAGSAWLVRRLGAGQHGAGGLRVVGGVAVGPKERVALVEVGDTWLLVGVAPGRVNALHVMPRQALAVEGGAEGTPAPLFAEWLKRAVQGRDSNK